MMKAQQSHMHRPTRVYVLGAGFSKPAGMPLATELLAPLTAELGLGEIRTWLHGLRERLAWLESNDETPGSFALNIEQVFHYAQFEIEAHRLRQHCASVGRQDGPGTPWNHAETITAWLSYLEEALRDVILQCDQKADLTPIIRWAQHVRDGDSVLTFNYDTLVERALAEVGQAWSHGFESETDRRNPVLKLHGSIDWIVAHRSQSFSKADLLFDKPNANLPKHNTGHVEDDFRLWRVRSTKSLSEWIENRDLQSNAPQADAASVGIGGLGAYKELHAVPGLGPTWLRAMRALHQADLAVVVGFSLSDFDALAQMQFAEVARDRCKRGRPLHVIVIDPNKDKASKTRFKRVFRKVWFRHRMHQDFNWSRIDSLAHN